MFGLTGATKYKYIPNYMDMRGGYDKLSGVVRSLGENPENGTCRQSQHPSLRKSRRRS